MNDEHVQPVQSLTPNRRGNRLRTLVGVLAPVTVLVVVVSGGVLGRTAAEEIPASPAATEPARAATLPAGATPAPAPERGSGLGFAAVGFPPDALGLPVRSVEDTIERIRSGRMRESVVAVAGWLTVQPPSDDCRNEVDRGTGPTALCPRQTILVATPEPVRECCGGGDRESLMRPFAPNLRPVAMPGVSLGPLAGRRGRATPPTPVVVIGRIGDPRLPDCLASGRDCDDGIALERLAWVGGEWLDPRPLVTTPPVDGADPSPEARRRGIDAAVPGAGTVLSEILVPHDALPGVDSVASAAVDDLEDEVTGAVWYARFLVRIVGPGGAYPRDVGWAVIDDATGEVVAARPARSISAASPFPRSVLGIDTVDASAAGRLLRAGVEPDRLIAVAGWLTLAPEGAACRSDLPLACRRTGLLTEVPTVDGGGTLFVETRPDVTIVGVDPRRARPDSWSVPVTAVVVGRFVPRTDRECGLRRPNCEPVFSVDLLGWLDGSEIAPPDLGATDRAGRRTPAEVIATARVAIRGAGEVIGLALVDPERIATLEPRAAEVAAEGGATEGGPVWLVRTVAFRARQDMWYEPLAGWAMIDDATGSILAAAPSRAGAASWRP